MKKFTVAALLVLSQVGCGGENRPAGPRASGPSQFVTPVPMVGGNGSDFGPGVSSLRDRPRGLPQAELAVTFGSSALLLNEYRGLLRVDLAGPQPRQTGRVAVIGQPVALFVDGDIGYALLTEAFSERVCVNCPGGGGSLMVVDLSAGGLRVQARLSLGGSLAAARLRGRTLEVVVRGHGQFPSMPGDTVLTVDVTDVANPRIARRLELPGPAFVDQVLFSSDRLYLAMYGWQGWTGSACVPLTNAEVMAPATAPEGCGQLIAVDLVAGTVSAQLDLQGRVAPGGLHHREGVLRALLERAPRAKSVNATTPVLATFRTQTTPEDLTPLARLTLPALGPWAGSPPLVRFTDRRAYLATLDPARAILIVDLSAPDAPAIVGEVLTTGPISEIVAATDQRLLTIGQDGPPGACVGRQLALHDVTDAGQPALLIHQVLADDVHGGVALVSPTLLTVPYLFADAAAGWTGQPRVGLQLFDVDLSAGDLRPRGRTTADGARVGQVVATADGMGLLLISSEHLMHVDVRDRDRPGVGAMQLSRWVQEVRFTTSAAVQVTRETTTETLRLHLVPVDDLDSPHPLATVDYPGTLGRLIVHGDLLYLFWSARLNNGSGEPRLDIIEVVDRSFRVRSSRSMPGPAWVDFGPENDGDGPSAGGVRQLGTNTFLVPVRRVTSCEPANEISTPGSPGRRPGSCAPMASSSPSSNVGVAPGVPMTEAPAVTARRRNLAGACPGSEADFLVLDARHPDAPLVASLVRIGGDGAEFGPSVVQGTTAFITRGESVPIGSQQPTAARYHVSQLDLADPANPRLDPEVNVPGLFLGARPSDHTWFTAEPVLDGMSRPVGMTISALYRPAGSPRAYLERRLPIEGGISGPVFDGTVLVAAVDGALAVIDLAGTEAPSLLSRTPVPGATTSVDWPGGGLPVVEAAAPMDPRVLATAHHVVGGHAFVLVNGGLMRVFDLRSPERPRLLEQQVYSPRGAHPVRLAPGNRAAVPRAEWGVAIVDLSPAAP